MPYIVREIAQQLFFQKKHKSEFYIWRKVALLKPSHNILLPVFQV